MVRKVTVSQNDTFAEWQDKTNDLSDNVGEPENLNTANQTDLVSAINEVNVIPADRGGLAKDTDGKLLADVDDASIDITSGNKIQIKNDGVQRQHLNPSVAGAGLDQTQDEGLVVKVGEDSGIAIIDGRVGIKDNGVKVGKHALQDQGSLITFGNAGAPFILGPGTDGQVLTAGGADVNASWGTAPGTKVLGHSGYINDGRVAGGNSTTVTIKSAINLTNPVNALSTPGGLKTEYDSGHYRNYGAAIIPADSNYGMLWTCDEGVVVVRDLKYYQIVIQNGDDYAWEELMWGIRIFNIADETYISFKIQSTQGGDVRSGECMAVSQHFIVAELLSGATNPTNTYYDATGSVAIVEWAEHTNYTEDQYVTASGRLYQNLTEGTNASGPASTKPVHAYFHQGWNAKRGAEIAGGLTKRMPGTSGFVQYQNLTWMYMGEV